jgi:hypothetical protein
MPDAKKCQACRKSKKAVSAPSCHETFDRIENDTINLFSVHETAESGMSKTLKQDAAAARAGTLAVAPTSTKTRMTKGNQKEYLAWDKDLEMQTFEGCSW